MPQITKLFGESPFGAVKEHAEKVHGCVRLMKDLFKSVEDGDSAGTKEVADRVIELETEADKIQNRVHEQLVSKVMLPVNKAELFNILEQQDSMADVAEEIAGLLSYRKMRLPTEVMAAVNEYLRRTLVNCELAEGIISKLDILVEASFSGRDALTVSRLVSELNQREDADKSIQIEVMRKLFGAEGELSAVDLLLWQQVIGKIAELSRYADHTGSAIRRVLEIR